MSADTNEVLRQIGLTREDVMRLTARYRGDREPDTTERWVREGNRLVKRVVNMEKEEEVWP